MHSAQLFAAQRSPAAVHLLKLLLDDGQSHLFANWDPPGQNDDAKHTFFEQLERVHANYPGGIPAYTANARRLLAQARDQVNPFEGFTPQQPDTVDLSAFDAEYDRIEALGADAFARTGVVLVAGGLGERLGYSGIKLAIPVEVLEGWSYLRHYAANLLAMEARMAAPRPVPFVIMTSGDTHDKTLAELEANDYFGLRRDQVHILRQELVPALVNNNAHLSLEAPCRLELKPHGHGDVHMLLHQSGVAARLRDQGIEHLVFIQDTNGQVFNALPAAVGVSIDRGFDFNSLAVNRVPGEAVGGLARLFKPGADITINVEYNQLDPLLRSTINPAGDVAGANGFSVFPGNINVLVVKVASYVKILARTSGIIAEFVNPKYADAARSTFKKPTRLETMMQDLPKLFGPEQKVGVTVFDRIWCFSPNKNKVADAAAKHAAASPPESAATAESDFYKAGRLKLATAGMGVVESEQQLIQGVPYTDGPRVILRPSFAMTLREVRAKIKGGRIAGTGTLILDGDGIRLEDVIIEDGKALIVHGETRTLCGNIQTPAPRLQLLDPADTSAEETLLMRGYRSGE